jgi:selenocysteine lyase/cysteine desulfurase
MTTRRSFLAGGGAAVAGAAVLANAAGCGPENRRAAPARLDPGDWASVRAQFDLDRSVRQLSAFVLAAHPAPVRAAIERHRRGLDADTHGYLAAHQGKLEEDVRSAAARYLDADADEIALTDSTTMGLGIVYGGLRLRPGDELLTTEHDFYSTHEALRLAAERSGAVVRRVRLYDDPAKADPDAMVAALVRAVTPRTRVVAVTWVHSSTGVKLPIRRIADALPPGAPADRALFCADGVHGFGSDAATVTELGCDVLASGCHKWLFGPRGTGLVWARRTAWDRVTATIPTFDPSGFASWFGIPGRAPASFSARMTAGGYHAFEHRWALAQAFGLHLDVGQRRIADRTAALADQLKEGLAGMAHVRLVTPRAREVSAGLVCCAIAGQTPSDAVARLHDRHRVAATVTPYSTPLVRFGPSIVNSEDDIEATLRAVRALA